MFILINYTLLINNFDEFNNFAEQIIRYSLINFNFNIYNLYLM